MMQSFILVLCLAACSALPANPILNKLDDGPRYQYEADSNGDLHLVDGWMSPWDFMGSSRYNPTTSNAYHLFTRDNPRISQPIVTNPDLLSQTNYNGTKRTIVLIHGWRNSVTSDFNNVLVPAFLAVEDVNVIVVDWSAGADSFDYKKVNLNCLTSASAVARFINWLNEQSNSTLDRYHIIGHGVGGHQAGIVGRNLDRKVAYITGLDPALLGWNDNVFRFRRNDALYTEVIHTNNGVNSYIADLAKVDFYPNGGTSMPGCNSNACSHARGFHYLAESIRTGGFTGTECANYAAAIVKMCPGEKRLPMGGLTPKTGQTGVYLVETNASPPFSRG